MTSKKMMNYVKFKRKNGNVFEWPTKLYIPVPLITKNSFVKIADLNGMSQAELGAVVVMHYLQNLKLFKAAIDEYRAAQDEERTEYIEEMQGVSKTKEPDRTFGGMFKPTFKDEEDETERVQKNS